MATSGEVVCPPYLRHAPSAVPSMWPAKEKQQAHVLCDSWATRLKLKATANYYTNEEKDYPMEGYYYYCCLVCLVVVVRNFYSNFYKFPGFITEPLIVGPHFTSNLSQRRKDAAGQWWTLSGQCWTNIGCDSIINGVWIYWSSVYLFHLLDM